MKSARRTYLTQHRRQRLVLWALAMLAWLAAVLFANAPISARQARQRGDVSLTSLTRLTMKLLIVRAGELARMRLPRSPRFWKHGRDLRRRHLMRSVIGSTLRRALTHRDLATRIARVIAVLRNLDTHARALFKRLRGRLTRLFAIVAAPMPFDAILAPPAFSPALCDSS